ncbi:MAG: cytochrome c [Anaerolineae bacterium]|jgi:mono/diheme cytochrome c family protein|nr:cytochrome c [Anaerolineae bacterium]MBT7070575.1 cytochrome c [Anaerolineae bacterium]MBT7324906.1 cytochrome c [Anaerolineae bacterium]
MSNRARKDRRKKKQAERLQKTLSLVFIGVLIIGLAAWLSSQNNRPSEALASRDVLALGEEVYAANCATCHGANGEGHGEVEVAPALDATEHAWHHADGQLQGLIVNGGEQMPPFGESLTNDEVVAVIRYFQTWWSEGQLNSQQSLSEQDPLR